MANYSEVGGENVTLLNAILSGARSYTGDTNSRNSAILKSIINETPYTAQPESEIEELLLEVKAKIESGGGGDLVDLIERDVVSMTIPEDVTGIGQSAFNGCTNLESIDLGDSITSIGDYAFSGCTSLESIEIPDSVTSVGQYAFSANTSLESAVVGTGITAMAACMFINCTSLMSLTMKATTPPTLLASSLSNVPANCVIYVPAESVSEYKAASNWSNRSEYIQAISE